MGRHTKLQTNICTQGWRINVNRLMQEVEAFSSISEIDCVCKGGVQNHICTNIMNSGGEVLWSVWPQNTDKAAEENVVDNTHRC